MSRRVTPETERRIRLAASMVEPRDYRQAAIIGGIVNGFITKGQLDTNFVRHAAAAAMDWGRIMADTSLNGAGTRLLPNAATPDESEVVAALVKWREAYARLEGK